MDFGWLVWAVFVVFCVMLGTIVLMVLSALIVFVAGWVSTWGREEESDGG